MRILYWYTHFLFSNGQPRQYRGLGEFELNLGTQRSYSFSREDKKLNSTPLETPLPPDFWSKGLYNLNALIGQNGSGKTAIMHYMLDVLHSLHRRDPMLQDETLILMEYGQKKTLLHLCPRSSDSYTVCESDEYSYCRISPDAAGKPCISDEAEKVLSVLDRLKLIYLTNTLTLADDERVRAYNHTDHLRHHFIYDCSTSGLLRYDVLGDCDANRTGDNLLSFFQTEFFRQIRFFCNTDLFESFQKGTDDRDSDAGNRCDLRLPSRLTIRLHFPESEDFKQSDLRAFCCNGSLADELRQSSRPELSYAALLLCCACTRAFERNLKRGSILPALIPQAAYRLDSLRFESFERLFRRILREALYDRSLSVPPGIDGIEMLYENSLTFIGSVLSHLEEFGSAAEFPDSFGFSSDWQSFSFSIPLRNGDTILEDNLKWLQGFVNSYKKTCEPYYFLDFSWGLSSGESNLLRLFAALYDVVSVDRTNAKITNRIPKGTGSVKETECDSVLLLLDEADLTYHPEWQRRYVSTLAELMPLVFRVRKDNGETASCISDLQILLSTHSPLMLGDIPKSNVSYLSRPDGEIESSDKIASFGENIHLILRNSFFLNKGTLGSFAAKRINQTVQDLRTISGDTENNRQLLERCRTVIALLAPGPIKFKLEEMYREAKKEPSREELLAKIAELETALAAKERIMKQQENSVRGEEE